MATRESAATLRPVRRPRLPRGGTLLRVALVAALLGLAAAVLHTPSGCPPAPSNRAAPLTRPTAGDGARAAPTAPADAPARTGTASTGGEGAPGPLPLPHGTVGVPVRLAEPAALAVLRPGARVDLLAVPPGEAAEATLLASNALVLDVVGAAAVDGPSALYLALRPDQAHRAVAQPEGSRFTVVVRA